MLGACCCRGPHRYRNDGPRVRDGDDEDDWQTYQHNQLVGLLHARWAIVCCGGIRPARKPEGLLATAPTLFWLWACHWHRPQGEEDIDTKGSRLFCLPSRPRHGIPCLTESEFRCTVNLCVWSQWKLPQNFLHAAVCYMSLTHSQALRPM